MVIDWSSIMDLKGNTQTQNGEDTPDVFKFGSPRSYGSEVAPLVVHRTATHYKMDHPKRGIAAIFNHEKFLLSHLKERSGTQADCLNLKRCWENLGFEVTVHNDLGTKHLMDEIDSLANVDYSDMDCLVICVLSHGEEGVIFSKDSAYKHEQLWEKFTSNKCKSLAGKPKLFFIQACQGTRLDPGSLLQTEVDARVDSYKIPIHADFLFAYSTIPGFYSWRNTTRGSWFIQALTTELRENSYNCDLLTLLTFVNRRVATDYESNTPDNHIMHAQKQIPCITSMLTRIVQFTPKRT